MIRQRYSKYQKTVFMFCDLVLLNGALFIGFLLVFTDITRFGNDTNILLFVLFNLLWILASEYFHLYDLPRFLKSENVIIKLGKTTLMTFLLVFAIVFFLKYYQVSRFMIYYALVVFFSLAVIFRILLIPFLKWYRKSGYNYRNLIIIGSGPVAREVLSIFSSDQSIGLRILGVFDDEPHPEVSLKLKGSIEDAKVFALQHKVDEVIVALPEPDKKMIHSLVKFCDNNMMRITIVPDFYRKYAYQFHVGFYGHIPFLSLRNEPLQSLRNRLIKRLFDLVFSLCVIILVFPWFLPLLALLIKLGSPGPVFFVQDRSGLNNRVFRMIKFRTMRVNLEADEKQAYRGDPRITPIGAFLRKTNLDEMPQFFNVLTGDMSVVGPRPHMLKHTETYSRIVDRFMVRQIVKPGLTGWAQVTGSRGETGKPELMAERVRKDVWYIENWTFWLDLRIVGKTVANMIRGEKNAV